jgi:histone H1/5
MKTIEEKKAAAAAKKAAAAAKKAAAAAAAAAKKAAAAAPSVEAAAAIVEAAAPAPSRRDKREAFQVEAAAAQAIVDSALHGGEEHEPDVYGTRKKGGRVLNQAQGAYLIASLAKVKESGWELKGGATARQFAGVLSPIVLPPDSSPTEKARAAGINRALQGFHGFPARVIRFTGKKGVGYAAWITVLGR